MCTSEDVNVDRSGVGGKRSILGQTHYKSNPRSADSISGDHLRPRWQLTRFSKG